MLTSAQIRQKYWDFFMRNGHTKVASSSLVPHNDPTLLFTNAGMVQFKDTFLGLEKRSYTRAVTAQKCVRAGGKHNDLDTVGRTARHHTFFEMLGNFSFGDYFKRDAITFAWTFLTEELGLPKDKLYITVYKDDEEARALWKEIAGIPDERIFGLGEKDNFWSMGDTGPCGPCSEIMVDRGEQYRCDAEECAIGKCDCDRWLEIWNLVFMQYNRDAEGNMTPLPRPSIDTGMGLERIAAVLQNVQSNYDTDLFTVIMKKVEELCGKTYDRGVKGFPFRVIADHVRSCTFLIADGVMPSNEGRGYVLRRILRRAVRFGKQLGMQDAFLYQIVPTVVSLMGDAYPEIAEKEDFIAKVIKIEEERFQETLNDGIRVAEEMMAAIQKEGRSGFSGQEAFLLYDTYGFPIDLAKDIAEENGLKVDEAGFLQAMEEQRKRARASRSAENGFDEAVELSNLFSSIAVGPFVGYQELACQTQLLGLVKDGQLVKEANSGDTVYVVLAKTPFYAESGGQAADKGVIQGATGNLQVNDVHKLPNGFIYHKCSVEGSINVGESVDAVVDMANRKATARNHSATHLLHKALRGHLGTHVQQAGSMVDGQRLRFDFNHFAPLQPEELAAIEKEVNDAILADYPVVTEELPIEEAKKQGAMALFGEKYGNVVRMVSMGDYSRELCGGTHCKATGEIGQIKIVSEAGIGAGLRRIEALTGWNAIHYWQEKEEELQNVANVLKAVPGEIVKKVENLQSERKQLEKELEKVNDKLAQEAMQHLTENCKEIAGIPVLITEVAAKDMNALRHMMDMSKEKMGQAIIVLAAVSDGKVNIVASCPKELGIKTLHAGNIVKIAAAACGGGGGGRPDMAQAGGKNPEKMAEALQAACLEVEKQLTAVQ